MALRFVIGGTRLSHSIRNIGSSAELWNSVVSVSNAGRKRGRGKRSGAKRQVDLYKGVQLGTGKARVQWPSLLKNPLEDKKIAKPTIELKQPEDEESDVKTPGMKRRKKTPPLERGYTGRSHGGRKIGPPDPVGDYKFKGFETVVLEGKMVAKMTGTLGRKMKFSMFVITGNGNGLAGFGLGKSPMIRVAQRVAKNRAAQNLIEIPLFEGHTVYHDMHTRFHFTNLFIHKKEKGYGLRCHRVIKSVCEAIGIKDLYVQVEGNTKNTQAMVHGFIEALVNQETHEQLAERSGYHVIEMRTEKYNFPEVVASPSGPTNDTPLSNEEEDIETDFTRIYHGGKTEYDKPKKLPFYYHYKSHQRRLANDHKMRNQWQAKILRDAGLG